MATGAEQSVKPELATPRSPEPPPRCSERLTEIVAIARRTTGAPAESPRECAAEQHGKLWVVDLLGESYGSRRVVVDERRGAPIAWTDPTAQPPACGLSTPRDAELDEAAAREFALSCLELVFGTPPQTDYPIDLERHGDLWLADYRHPHPLPSHTMRWLVVDATTGKFIASGYE